MSKYEHINTKDLKNLIETKATIIILDARSKEWDDGRRIPGATSLVFDASPSLYEQAIPNKNTLIAVYCGGPQCPAGPKLAENLVTAGYTNVVEYSGGIQEWADINNYPIERV